MIFSSVDQEGTTEADRGQPDSCGQVMMPGLRSTTIGTMDAEREAEQLLDTAWGNKFPVDPVKIARDLGIDVLEVEFEPNVAGAIFKEPGQDPTIFINATDSASRQRFTVAHELGHYVMHADEPDAFDYVDNRSAVSGADDHASPVERFADAFAASFLMPAKEVNRLMKEKYTPTQISAYFGVSQDAAYLRLKQLGHSTA
jgi:Zn-dependent peptidase ImmA (M78 family)